MQLLYSKFLLTYAHTNQVQHYLCKCTYMCTVIWYSIVYIEIKFKSWISMVLIYLLFFRQDLKNPKLSCYYLCVRFLMFYFRTYRCFNINLWYNGGQLSKERSRVPESVLIASTLHLLHLKQKWRGEYLPGRPPCGPLTRIEPTTRGPVVRHCCYWAARFFLCVWGGRSCGMSE